MVFHAGAGGAAAGFIPKPEFQPSGVHRTGKRSRCRGKAGRAGGGKAGTADGNPR